MNSHYCHLQRDALLHISGPDSLTFLQGQTTCDTRLVEGGRGVPGVYCTPQGRVVCDFLLSELGNEHFGLRMRREIRATSAAVFSKYIIFSKADLAAERDDWQVIGLWGADIAGALKSVFAGVPDEQYAAQSGPGFTLVQTDSQGEQFECYVDSGSASDLLKRLETALTPGSEEDWELLQVTDGIARIEAATSGEFVPQILNYDLTGHLNFSKGCYTGQEVVARLHYRGKPKRRTYLAKLDSNHAVAVGTPVYTQGVKASVGNVINAVVRETATVLLVAATASGSASGLHLENPQGPEISLLEQPYALATEEAT